MTLEAIVPVPDEITQRAWECAFDLAQAMGSSRTPARPTTWAGCRALFAWHRVVWPART